MTFEAVLWAGFWALWTVAVVAGVAYPAYLVVDDILTRRRLNAKLKGRE